MREIKFRAWHKDGEMFYKVPLNSVGQHARYGEDAVLMQYTGLHDKKRTEEYPEGQEIYEGDIVRSAHPNVKLLKVGFQDGGFVDIPIDQDFRDNPLRLCPDNSLLWDCEVIGNTHENPELLGKKETT